MPLPGYQRIPGSAGRYLETSSGREISRRQYENVKVQQTYGLSSLSEFNRMKKEPRFEYLSKAWAQSKEVSLRKARAQNSPFVQQYLKATKQKWDRKAKSAYARLLVDIGYRDENAYWNVGDTPKLGGVI